MAYAWWKRAALGGEAIDAGSRHVDAAVTAEDLAADVVGEDEHDVGPIGVGGAS